VAVKRAPYILLVLLALTVSAHAQESENVEELTEEDKAVPHLQKWFENTDRLVIAPPLRS
jgi:hypothetical protein